MKITSEDYATLEKACQAVLKKHNLHPYMIQNTANAWQIFHKAANEYGLYGLYEYLNDAHIETALKRIFKN